MITPEDREAARELGASAPPLSHEQSRMVRRIIASEWRQPWGGETWQVRPSGEISSRDDGETMMIADSVDDAEDHLIDLGFERIR